MLGTDKRKIYLTIGFGKVNTTTEGGERKSYSYVDGYLHSISQVEKTYGNERVKKWYIYLSDQETSEEYILSFPYSSGAFNSIVLALATEENLSTESPIRIEPYNKGNYTNVSVWVNGVKLDWITKELPPVTTVQVGSQTVKDDTKRIEYISSLVNLINERLNK